MQCNNCGKAGHNFYQCKLPIISNGIIAFRTTPAGKKEYLMIKRKETLGFIDFLRGKYAVNNTEYIENMIKQMTVTEKQMLNEWEFDDLWMHTWKQEPRKCGEEIVSKDKFNLLRTSGKLAELLNNPNNPVWHEPEWGFPKGRRENGETDFECALREFKEETGIEPENVLENIIPYEEIFMGSNYKAYKHKYYIMHVKYVDDCNLQKIDTNEISEMKWMQFRECMSAIRSYNLERRKILVSINMVLTKYIVIDASAPQS